MTTYRKVEISGHQFEMLGTVNDGDCKVRLKNVKGQAVDMLCEDFIEGLNKGTTKYID
ncbi:hypothetical protein [Acetobacter indonesiensis]|uniref:hypothetical protein n=1 Tax=Acetobacter indonesiensis TaxID=104101 RepID=UPI0039E92F28